MFFLVRGASGATPQTQGPLSPPQISELTVCCVLLLRNLGLEHRPAARQPSTLILTRRKVGATGVAIFPRSVLGASTLLILMTRMCLSNFRANINEFREEKGLSLQTQ